MIGNPAQLTMWLINQMPDKLFKISEYRRKRSLTQNAYYWALLNRLARAVGISSFECHKKILKDYGESELISIRKDVPLNGYFKYFDIVGEEQIGDNWFNHVRIYKGSSQMNSKEFTALIDGLRFECEAQGIPFMTPEEVEKLRFAEGVEL